MVKKKGIDPCNLSFIFIDRNRIGTSKIPHAKTKQGINLRWFSGYNSGDQNKFLRTSGCFQSGSVLPPKNQGDPDS
jgi:hypothetical protein